jgi:hypothetical protein
MCVTSRQVFDWWLDLLHTYTTCYYTSQIYVFSSPSSSTAICFQRITLDLEFTWNSGTRLNILNWTLLYKHFEGTEWNISFPIIPLLLCLPNRCLENCSSVVACLFISAGTGLPSRWLTMKNSDFQASFHISLLKNM